MVSFACPCKKLHSGLPSRELKCCNDMSPKPSADLWSSYYCSSGITPTCPGLSWLRTSELEQYSKWGFIRAEGQNHLLNLLITLLLMQPRIQLSFWAAPRNLFSQWARYKKKHPWKTGIFYWQCPWGIKGWCQSVTDQGILAVLCPQ